MITCEERGGNGGASGSKFEYFKTGLDTMEKRGTEVLVAGKAGASGLYRCQQTGYHQHAY